MTEEEFIEFYCKGNAGSWDVLQAYVRPVPCECGEEWCHGWVMVPV